MSTASCPPATGSLAPPRLGSADFTAAYIKAYGGTADTIDNSSAEAYATGQLLEEVAKKTGKIDNATIIATLHRARGQPCSAT